MRHLLVAATAGLLFASGAAFAQSGQGGYIGKNPAPEPSTSRPGMSQPPTQGSGQGGYLGKNPETNTSGSSGVPAQGSGQGGYLGNNAGGNPAYTGQQPPTAGSPQQPRR